MIIHLVGERDRFAFGNVELIKVGPRLPIGLWIVSQVAFKNVGQDFANAKILRVDLGIGRLDVTTRSGGAGCGRLPEIQLPMEGIRTRSAAATERAAALVYFANATLPRLIVGQRTSLGVIRLVENSPVGGGETEDLRFDWRRQGAHELRHVVGHGARLEFLGGRMADLGTHGEDGVIEQAVRCLRIVALGERFDDREIEFEFFDVGSRLAFPRDGVFEGRNLAHVGDIAERSERGGAGRSLFTDGLPAKGQELRLHFGEDRCRTGLLALGVFDLLIGVESAAVWPDAKSAAGVLMRRVRPQDMGPVIDLFVLEALLEAPASKLFVLVGRSRHLRT